jgi:hypothetical protein
MSEWLYVHPVDQPPPVEPDAFDRWYALQRLVMEAFSRQARTLEIAAWQRRAGWPRALVVVETEYADVAHPETVDMKHLEEHGSRKVLCRMRLPEQWLGGPVDGVMAFRIQLAITSALDTIGETFGFGPITVRKAPTAASNLDVEDLFSPHDVAGPFQAIAARVHETAVTMPNDAVLLVARHEALPQAVAACVRLRNGLGNVSSEEDLTTENGKAFRAWTLRLT